MTNLEHDRSYQELLQQNLALQQELEALKSQQPFVWNLFAETARRLQIHSASIKAAVSSLLDYDIFWDTANQHEFLKSIDSSINLVSDTIVLMTLAFLAEAHNLALRQDSHFIQEILSVSQMAAARKYPTLKLEIDFPSEGRPVLVDYEYLTKALLLLYDVLSARAPTQPVRVIAREENRLWSLDFVGLDPLLVQTIEQMHHCKAQPASSELLSTENILRLHLMCEILHLQRVMVDTLEEPGSPPVLRLTIPEAVVA